MSQRNDTDDKSGTSSSLGILGVKLRVHDTQMLWTPGNDSSPSSGVWVASRRGGNMASPWWHARSYRCVAQDEEKHSVYEENTSQRHFGDARITSVCDIWYPSRRLQYSTLRCISTGLLDASKRDF